MKNYTNNEIRQSYRQTLQSASIPQKVSKVFTTNNGAIFATTCVAVK